MKHDLEFFLNVNGTPNPSRYKEFKKDLFAYGQTPTMVIDTAGTTGFTISAAMTTGILISGATTTAVDVTGASTTGVKVTDAVTGILLNFTASKTEGVSITVATTKTLTTGMSLSGAGTITTGLLLDATAFGTAVSISGASAYGISISGAATSAAIYISATSSRAILIGNKGSTYANSTAIAISSIGGTLDTEPGNNFLMGVFSKVATSETTTSTDDLGSAWFRTRVNTGITIGANYSLYGARGQLRIYATGGAATSISNWAASGLMGVLEVSGATTTFQSGCVAAAGYFNVSLTTTTVLASGAVIAGVVINTGSAALTDTGAAYFGLYVQNYAAVAVNFDVAIKVGNSCSTTGVEVGTCTTGLYFSGTQTTHISSATAIVTNMPVASAGAGYTAAGVKWVPFGKRGSSGLFVTELYIDLGDAAVSSKNTAGDIIGKAAGGAAYVGQITAANHGTVVAIEIICLETPATGDDDIDFYSATEGTGAYDGAIGDLAEAVVYERAAAWAAGDVKIASALPAANKYLYLTSGNGDTAGAYSAGKFLIRIYGS